MRKCASFVTVPGRNEVKKVANNEGGYTSQHEGDVPDHSMEGQVGYLSSRKSCKS